MSKKKPKNSRAKGCRGERLASEFLRSLGFASAKRTQQFNGLADQGDVSAQEELPDVHIEVKVGSAAVWDLGVKKLTDACDQARRDAKGKPWVVLWKPDRKCWRLTTEMQPEGCPVGLATVTEEVSIQAILYSKQMSAASPPKRQKRKAQGASGYRNPLKRRVS
jgi:Holliday junction resolvase